MDYVPLETIAGRGHTMALMLMTEMIEDTGER